MILVDNVINVFFCHSTVSLELMTHCVPLLAPTGRVSLDVCIAAADVHENLNPDTGLGDDVGNSNPMYHW